jgi:hypothetical protein
MKMIRMAAVIAAGSFMAACGGGGGGATTPGGPTSWPMVAPTVGATSVYGVTSIDYTTSTVLTSYRDQVTRVDGDGTYAIYRDDPTNSGATVNGIDYSLAPATLDFDAQGRETGFDIASTGAACTFTPLDSGHALPWTVGQAFTDSVSETCGGGPVSITYATTGTVASLESVTVAAGTFQALKIQATETNDTPDGYHVVTTVSKWVDPQHSFFTLREVDLTTTTPTSAYHYVQSRTVELQSRTY